MERKETPVYPERNPQVRLRSTETQPRTTAKVGAANMEHIPKLTSPT